MDGEQTISPRRFTLRRLTQEDAERYVELRRRMLELAP
jgi:hypothetical protein